MGLKEKAREINRNLPALFLALRKKETPWYVKAIVAITVVYALSPIDLIPDFIPVLGYLDDLIILPAFITLAVRLIPSPVFRQCQEEAKTLWPDGRPKKWYYAWPVIILWALIVYLIVRMIWR